MSISINLNILYITVYQQFKQCLSINKLGIKVNQQFKQFLRQLTNLVLKSTNNLNDAYINEQLKY